MTSEVLRPPAAPPEPKAWTADELERMVRGFLESGYTVMVERDSRNDREPTASLDQRVREARRIKSAVK